MVPALATAAAALVTGLPGADEAETFLEVPLAAGVPDLVIVAFDDTTITERRVANLAPVVDVAHARTLATLTRGTNRLDDLAQEAGVSAPHLRRSVLPALVTAGWIEPLTPRTRHIVLTHAYRPVVRWAVTVEAKRSAWAYAAAQAQRHLAAADRAFVALDAAHARRALLAADHLAATGIGIATVTAPATVAEPAAVDVVSYPHPRRPHLPKRHRTPDPAAKGLLGERVWQLRLAGLRSGPTYPVFGQDLSIA